MVIAGAGDLPAWTAAGLGWGMVNIFLKVLLIAINTLLALILITRRRENARMGFQD